MLKRLKKIALLFVSILVLFSGMSCSSGDDNDGNTNTENESNNNNNNNDNNNNADNNDGENNTDELPESVGTNPFAGKTFIDADDEDIDEYRFTENKVTMVEFYGRKEEIVAAYNYTYDIEKQLLYMTPDVNFLYGSMDEAIEYMISVGVEESDTDLLMVSAQAIEHHEYEILDGNKLRLAQTYDPNDLRTISADIDDSGYSIYYNYGYIDFAVSGPDYSAFIEYDGNNFSGSIYSQEYNEEGDIVSYIKKGEIKGTYSIDSENNTFTLTVTECPAEIDIKGTHVLDIYC